jgi:hypothetical protein
MSNREHLVTVTISTSSDFRINAHGGIFVDVRDGDANGRQMTTRNPATLPEALAFVDELRAAAKRSGKAIRFDIVNAIRVAHLSADTAEALGFQFTVED